ncbi:MAG: alkaline phosphatase family protein [Pirellulales bacterium]|nr:alkaline phosphatase family protein [Pirellulales bacterium]
MTAILPRTTAPRQLMLLEWDGATLEALSMLADGGVMPNLDALLRSSARMRLRWTGLGSPASAWATLRSGRGAECHGIWDNSYLDHRRGWVRPVDPAAAPCPFLPELLLAQDTEAHCVLLSDGAAGTRVWSRKPASQEELADRIRQSREILDRMVEQVRRAAASSWRLLEIRMCTAAALQHRIWHLVGADPEIGGTSPWTPTAQQAFRDLDRMLGELAEIADRQGAAFALTSPYGFVRSREKITLAELLRRRELFEVATGLARMGHRARRSIWRSVRPWIARDGRRTTPGIYYPVRALLPVDWRRSRAVALHGDHAALIYLNTPDRFGSRVLATERAREQALEDVLAALREARHPVSGEPLLVDVFSTTVRYGCDPLERAWPDVIGLPAPGFQTRHRPDHKRHVLRLDSSLAATQGGDGLLLVHGAGIEPGEKPTAGLTDVAPLLTELLVGESAVPAIQRMRKPAHSSALLG